MMGRYITAPFAWTRRCIYCKTEVTWTRNSYIEIREVVPDRYVCSDCGGDVSEEKREEYYFNIRRLRRLGMDKESVEELMEVLRELWSFYGYNIYGITDNHAFIRSMSNKLKDIGRDISEKVWQQVKGNFEKMLKIILDDKLPYLDYDYANRIMRGLVEMSDEFDQTLAPKIADVIHDWEIARKIYIGTDVYHRMINPKHYREFQERMGIESKK